MDLTGRRSQVIAWTVSSNLRSNILLRPCDFIGFKQTKKSFKSRMPSCDTSVFSELVGSLQLSHWQREFALCEYLRAVKMLCWGILKSFSPLVFSAHSPQTALAGGVPLYFLLSHTSHFLSTLYHIFHIFSPSFLSPV